MKIALVPSLCVMLAGAMLILLMAGCTTGNEAQSYVPEASELCCHGNWEVLQLEGSPPEEGECIDWQKPQLHEARACWNRLYINTMVRPGEPTRLSVRVSLLQDSAHASGWLASFFPGTRDNDPDYSEVDDPLVGDYARAWDLDSEDLGFLGTTAAFYRENIAVVVHVSEGTTEQRLIMFESVDQAVLDRIYGYD